MLKKSSLIALIDSIAFINFIFVVSTGILMRFILHWRFIRNVFRGRIKKANASRLILGLVGLLAVLALAVAPFVVPIENSERNSGYQYGKHK